MARWKTLVKSSGTVAVFLATVISMVGVAPAAAQDVSEDVRRMVREGMADSLETRLRGGRTAQEKHLLAQAYANKARKARRATDRERAYEEAAGKYTAWVEALQATSRGGDVLDKVRLAAGRVEFASMILSGQAAGELDEYEITHGHRGDRDKLVELLERAGTQYQQARETIQPIVDDLPSYEDQLFAAGLYDEVQQTRLDAILNLGWVNYYLGVLAKDDAFRSRSLATAERRFQDLIDLGQTGQMRYRCYLALGMAQREQGDIGDALRSFERALGPDANAVVSAQVRYEYAKTLIAGQKYDEARTILRPLVSKDPQNLSAEDRPARFYINLAHVWDAYSYLLESIEIRKEASSSTARTAILQKAERTREKGLGKFKQLAQQGGPWPALVQIYVASTVNTRTRPADLSPVELLYTAGVLMDARRYTDALIRLEEAASREGIDDDVAGDVLFALGRCHYLIKQRREAAETFAQLASTYRGHDKAPQAAQFAYTLWGQIAQDSNAEADYARLADVLRNLVESFADHPKREEALWLLPVSLQLAGRYDKAAREFGKIAEYSPHYEEAQYRRAICRKKAIESQRGQLEAAEYRAQAAAVAELLVDYADAAMQRVDLAERPDEVRTWSATARISAAELLASRGVGAYQAAIDAVDSFETQYPGSEQVGRVLALRIRAFRGLRQFDQASQILAQYLQTAPADRIGGTLAALAKGMQEEVERLIDTGQQEAAEALAADSVQTFAELEKWVRADESRSASLNFVLAGRARMHHLAGQNAEAERLVEELLKREPNNGNFQHLHAMTLTAGLDANASREALLAARDAWAQLLTDPAIRNRAPERYWEARTNWLRLSLRLGNAADVEKAITQERVWRPELGGEPWNGRLLDILADAQRAQGKTPTTSPATQPARESGGNSAASPTEGASRSG